MHPARFLAFACILLAACAETAPPEHPASLAGSLATLLEHVEAVEGPPAWAHPSPETDDLFYAVGGARDQKDAETGLFLAVRDAKTALRDALRQRGARVASPRGLVTPLDVDEASIELERIAHDAGRGRWYALARFDLAVAAAGDLARIQELDRGIAQALAVVRDADAASESRLGAALAILFALEHRFQRVEQARVFGGDAPAPAAVDPAAEDEARAFLAERSVRIDVQAPPTTGLAEAARQPFEELYLRTGEFGEDGSVSLRAAEESPWTRDDPDFALAGELVVALGGPDARPQTLPLRAVGRGRDADEARRQAERALVDEVRGRLRALLRSYDVL